jgi:hypothetical protein
VRGCLYTSVVDPHHVDADRMRIRIRLITLMQIRIQIFLFDTDPDADPDPQHCSIHQPRPVMMYIVEHYTLLTRSTATHINKYSLQRERKKTKRKKK